MAGSASAHPRQPHARRAATLTRQRPRLELVLREVKFLCRPGSPVRLPIPDLKDTLYLNRAHSVGHARQHVNLLGYALMVNSLALHEHRQRQRLASAA